MKILVVSSFLPYPLDSGGHVRLYNIIKQLSSKHNITLVCEMRSHQSDEDITEIKKLCETVVTVKRKKQWSIENIAKTATSAFPFLLVGHTLPEMKQEIVNQLNNTRFDVIHVETMYVFQNLPKTYLPTVLVEHNIEYMVYEKFAQKAPIYLRPFLMADILKIKKWEEMFWKKATKLVAVSEEEKNLMQRTDAVVVPNGVDIKSFPFKKKKAKKTKTILFMGNFKWIQNVNTAEYIVKEIWPLIKTENVTLWIVGKHIPQNLKSFASKNIIFDENAPVETWKIYQKADILLSPIFVGGGTSYKILEAMASGVPVVTTELGIKGLKAKDNEHALIGENANQLASHVDTILSNNELYTTLTENAREFIEKNYTWESITKTLEKVYQDAVNNK
ncbi:MAG TPA: glycosyltransferase family 4 protein [Patescibacteria group bacterium]